MIFRTLAAAMALSAFPSTLYALQAWDPFTIPYDIPDLAFPDKPAPFSTGRESKMFKPDGAGPFPALVIMPTCDGQSYTMNTFDWAKRALDHGYVALVIDPLDPRGVTDNCGRPRRVPISRLLEDAFDAAAHLRRQPFVDRERVGYLGFSLGAMVGLGASGANYAHFPGGKPFRAIVSAYPMCVHENVNPKLGPGYPVDVQYMPDKVVVPLLVLIGDQDTMAGPPMNGCKRMSDERKALGAPIDYVIYPATHAWDVRELGTGGLHDKNANDDDEFFAYNPEVTEQSARDAFAFLDAHLKAD